MGRRQRQAATARRRRQPPTSPTTSPAPHQFQGVTVDAHGGLQAIGRGFFRDLARLDEAKSPAASPVRAQRAGEPERKPP